MSKTFNQYDAVTAVYNHVLETRFAVVMAYITKQGFVWQNMNIETSEKIQGKSTVTLDFKYVGDKNIPSKDRYLRLLDVVQRLRTVIPMPAGKREWTDKDGKKKIEYMPRTFGSGKDDDPYSYSVAFDVWSRTE